MRSSRKRVERPTDNKYKRGRGIHIWIIILLILAVVLTSGYIIYNRYIKKEDKKDNVTNLVNNLNNTGIPSEEERAKEGKAKETTIEEKNKAFEEFAKDFDGKVEYDKEKNIIGINIKNSESLDEGKKEETGKETIQLHEVREKFTKLIEGMGLVQIQLSIPEVTGDKDTAFVAIVKNTKGEYRSMQLRLIRNMDGNISKKIRYLTLAL
jgi:hypothetical protein